MSTGNTDHRGNHSQPDGAVVTRRLALNACDACRQRKVKCDEAQPQCERCARLRLSCHYRETSARKDPVLVQILTSLQRLESRVDNISKILINSRDTCPEPFDGCTQMSKVPESPRSTLPASKSGPIAGFARLSQKQSNHPLSSPSVTHSTAPQNILLWPCLQASLPIMDSVYGLRGEVIRHNERIINNRPVFRESIPVRDNILSSLTLSQVKCLTQAYFTNFPVYSPILSEAEFTGNILAPVIAGSLDAEVNRDIVSLVLLLGATTLADQGESPFPRDSLDESHLFLDPEESNSQLSNICSLIQSNNEISWRSAQALLLVGLYYSQKVNVLQHWQAVHKACTVIMTLISTSHPKPSEIQIYWVAYFHESQLLAEFEFPPSGISRYEDLLPFPFSDGYDVGESGKERRMSFLAHLALRKLLNRIHSNIYNHEDPQIRHERINDDFISGLAASSNLSTGFSPSLSIVEELDHQLESWRNHLPQELAFSRLDGMSPWQNEDLTTRRAASSYEKTLGFLKARYCAAKSIILRPFLYRLLNSGPQDHLSERDREGAKQCLSAVLQAPLHQGLLRDGLRSIQMPLNPCRCFFAGAILLRLVCKRPDLKWLLPVDWEISYLIQDRIEREASHLGPTVSEDMKILRKLDEILR